MPHGNVELRQTRPVIRGFAAALALAVVAATTQTAAGASGGGPPPARLAGAVVMGALRAPPSAAFLARVRAGHLGGVILMGRWRSRAEVAAVTAQLQRAACVAGAPLLVATDQEGGRVRRLTWAEPRPAAAEVDSPTQARAEAQAAARALRSAGVGIDLAPVADTPSSSSSFLGDRAFSPNPLLVGELATAFVAGLQQGGVAAAVKHFPGLGQAARSTDVGPVTIRAGSVALQRGLRPFREAITGGVRLVMVSSASYPALDPSGRPAVVSPRIVRDLLRGELGFDGVVVTDALDAPAAARIGHAPTKAIVAGVDLLLYASEPAAERGYATLLADARKYPRLRERLAAAAERLAALKSWLAAAGGPSCG